MKNIITTILMCSFISVNAQTLLSRSSFIESYKLEVTYNKTTSLVFPSAITSVDRGSSDILVQKAPGVENILRVKADLKDFPETSLSVITSDGKLYSFVVNYSKLPSYLNIDVAKVSRVDTVHTEQVIYSAPVLNKGLLAIFADSVMSRGANIRPLHDESAKVSISLNALYIHEETLFCSLSIKNTSNINFDIDQFHFYIRDKQSSTPTASQEIEVKPIFINGDTVMIRGQSQQPWIVALPKFTIPDGKILSIEIMEKNGGRNLSLKVKNRHIMKAKII